MLVGRVPLPLSDSNMSILILFYFLERDGTSKVLCKHYMNSNYYFAFSLKGPVCSMS